MASVQVLPLANYANGTRNIGPIDIADNVQSIDFNIQRCTTATPTIWPNSTTILDYASEMSIDGGPWQPAGGFTASGGIGFDKQHNEAPFTLGGGTLIAGINRQYRATLTISGGPLRSTATAEVN